MKLLLKRPSTTTGTTASKKRSLLFEHLHSLMATIQIVSPLTVSVSPRVPSPDNTNQDSTFPLPNCDSVLVSNNIIVTIAKTGHEVTPGSEVLELTFSSTQIVKLPNYSTIVKPPRSSTTLTFL